MDDVFKIDRLVIDLGKISDQFLESDIKKKIKNQLPIILAKLAIKPQLGSSSVSVKKSKLQILEFFLKNGYFPWWLSNVNKFDVDFLIKELFEDDPNQLKNIFEKLFRSSQIRRRLVLQLSEENLYTVTTIIAGDQISEYDSYLDHFHHLYQHPKIKARGYTSKAFQKYLKQLLFVYLGQKSQRDVSLYDLGIFFLNNLTSKFNLAPEGVQEFYQKRISRITTNKKEKILLESIDFLIRRDSKKSKLKTDNLLLETIESTTSREANHNFVFTKEQITEDLATAVFWEKVENNKLQFRKTDWEKISTILSNIMDENPKNFKNSFVEDLKKSNHSETVFPNLSSQSL